MHPTEAASQIGVIITTYNRPQKLERCLDSVLNQTVPPIEIIVVNDGSTEDYTHLKELFRSEHLVRWIDQPNGGVSDARNNGIAAAKANFLCLCDDDDYYLPNHIEQFATKLNLLDSPHILFSHSLELRDHQTNSVPMAEKPLDCSWQEFLVSKGQMVICCTGMPRSAFLEFPFPKDVRYAEDHEQRLKAMSRYPVAEIRDYTAVVDRTDETATNQSVFAISAIYRSRFKTIFADPLIRREIRRSFRVDQIFRWTSLELSELTKLNRDKFISHWFNCLLRIRSIRHLYTLMLHLVWYRKK